MAFTEVQLTKRQQYLFHDALVDQADLLLVRLFEGSERREYFDQGGHGSIRFVHLAHSELAIVRVEDAISADLIFQRKDLGFELDAILASYLWTHVNRRGLLLVGVTELEDDFRIAYGEAIDVGDAPAQNECVVVEAEVGSVAKNDLPDLGPQAGFAVLDKANTQLLRGACHDLAKVAEGLHGCEVVRFQDELGFEVLDAVEGGPVGIPRRVVRGSWSSRGGGGPGGFAFLFFLPLFIFRHCLPGFHPLPDQSERDEYARTLCLPELSRELSIWTVEGQGDRFRFFRSECETKGMGTCLVPDAVRSGSFDYGRRGDLRSG